MFLVLALILGVVCGLRTMMGPTAVSWAARLGLLAVAGTPMAFMGFKYTPIVLTVCALGELIVDKLPVTPSRKTPPQFVARIVSGSLVGGTVGAGAGSLVLGLMAGAIGAVIGTLAGASARGGLAATFRKDLPAALLEDVVAIVASVVAVTRL